MKKDRNLNRDRLDFANDNIGPMFRSLFFPTLVGMIFNSALTLIDGIFVGRGVGPEGIAAVNIVAPIFMVTTGIGLMFGTGSSVIASIRLLKNKVKAARIIMTQAFIIGLLLVGVIGLGSFVCPRGVVHALGCSPLLEENAVSYLLWLLPGLFFLFIECAGMMLIRLDGAPKYAMTIQILAAVVNIVLDWYMVVPLGLGVMGAALATSIACAVGGAMVFAYFFRFADKLRFYPLKLTLTSPLLTLRNTGYMVRIGFATFLTELAMSVMMITGNYMFISTRRRGCRGFRHRLLSFSGCFLDQQRRCPVSATDYQLQLRGASAPPRQPDAAHIGSYRCDMRNIGNGRTVGGSGAGSPPVSQSAGDCIYAGCRRFAAICLVRRILRDQYRLYRLLSEHRESDGFHHIYAVAGHIVPCAVFRPVAPDIRRPRPMACHSGSGTADLCRHLHPIRQAEIPSTCTCCAMNTPQAVF